MVSQETRSAKDEGRPAPPHGQPYAEWEESALIARAGSDPEAFAELYQRYVDRIYNYIFHRVGSVPDAEDLTARTFQRVYQHIGRYEEKGAPFSAWLYRIAHNLVANWYRDMGRRREVTLDGTVQFAARTPDPYQEVERMEEVDLVRDAVRHLHDDRQLLIILKHSEHLSNAEIAGIMGKTEGAVKSLYHRTLIALQEELRKRGLG